MIIILSTDIKLFLTKDIVVSLHFSSSIIKKYFLEMQGEST